MLNVLLDGSKSPKKRGHIAAVFKASKKTYRDPADEEQKPVPVTLTDADSVAEDHSWNLCNNVILYF